MEQSFFVKAFTILFSPRLSEGQSHFAELFMLTKLVLKLNHYEKLEIKEAFEKVSHDSGCRVDLAFHPSEVEEMTTENIT